MQNSQSFIYLFSYASNHPKQVSTRLNLSIQTLIHQSIPCQSIGYIRTFGLYSQIWKGSKANLKKKQGQFCKGIAYKLNIEIVNDMDKFESEYERIDLRLRQNDRQFDGVGYVQKLLSNEWHEPSEFYLKAIVETQKFYNEKKGIKQEIIIKIIDNELNLRGVYINKQ